MNNSIQIKYLLIQKNEHFIYYIFEQFFNRKPNLDELKIYQKKVNSSTKRLKVLKELINSSNTPNININAFEKIYKRNNKHPLLYRIYLFCASKKIIKKNSPPKINVGSLSEQEKYVFFELKKYLQNKRKYY